MEDAVIEANNVCVDFPMGGGGKKPGAAGGEGAYDGRLLVHGKRTLFRALNNINLKVRPGERIGLWGNNGSGKTTLLSTLRGVYPPTSGSLVMRGTTQSFFNLSFGFNQDATGYENILLRGVLMGGTPKQMANLTDDIAAFSELGDFLDLPMRGYSAGMRMRLAFSIATALPADILLIDEWLSVGDVEFREKAAARLIDLVAESRVLVMASHNRALLQQLCTRIIELRAGRITGD